MRKAERSVWGLGDEGRGAISCCSEGDGGDSRGRGKCEGQISHVIMR